MDLEQFKFDALSTIMTPWRGLPRKILATIKHGGGIMVWAAGVLLVLGSCALPAVMESHDVTMISGTIEKNPSTFIG